MSSPKQDPGSMTSVLKEERRFVPDAEFTKHARIQSHAEYASLHSQSLEDRLARVHGLLEYPLVEVEPGELAVDVEGRITQVGRHGVKQGGRPGAGAGRMEAGRGGPKIKRA